MTIVDFLPGDGHQYQVDVKYIAYDFAKGQDGTCAFCHGDPLNEDGTPDTQIALYYERNPRAETCPMCLGRPS